MPPWALWNIGSVTVGNGCSDDPKVLPPAVRLLFVPATSRRPNDSNGLTGDLAGLRHLDLCQDKVEVEAGSLTVMRGGLP